MGDITMVQITIDNELRKKLFASGEVVELRDERGNLLGRLLPEKDDPLEGWEPITPELPEEELQKAYEYDGPGMTTAELIARLKAKS